MSLQKNEFKESQPSNTTSLHVRFRPSPCISALSSPIHVTSDTDGGNASDAPSSIARKPSFEYITDTDESTYDGHDTLQFDEQQMPINIPNNHDFIELIQIQSQLKKCIGAQTHLILSQFTEIMRKIAPQMTIKESKETFDRIDRFHNGQIATNVLLNNEFLARMILKYLRDDYESSADIGNLESGDDRESTADYDRFKDMNHKQLLAETNRLQRWITSYGQPAVDRVTELEAIVNIYENERNTQQIQLSKQDRNTHVIIEELSVLKNELKQNVQRSSFLAVNNRKLALAAEESVDHWEDQRKQININRKELQRYKKLSKEISIINDKYLSKNKGLSFRNKELEQEMQDLRQIILALENDMMQLTQECNNERDSFMSEIEKLKSDLQNKEAKCAESNIQNAIESNESGGIGELMRQNRTITIDKESVMYDALTRQPSQKNIKQGSFKNFYSNSVSKHKYHRSRSVCSSTNLSNTSNSVQRVTMNSFDEIQESSDDQFDENEAVIVDGSQTDLDALFRMGTSFKQSNATFPVGSPTMQMYNQSIFEDAVTAEIKEVLRREIKEEFSEDFELKLYQKDIEHRLKVNKQKEKTEMERSELVERYEGLIAVYKRDLENANANMVRGERRQKSFSVTHSLTHSEFDTFDDEKEESDRPQWHSKGRKSVDMRFISDRSSKGSKDSNERKRKSIGDIQEKFQSRLEQIFTENALLWLYPMIK